MHQQRLKSLPVEATSIQNAALGFQLHFTLCALSRIAFGDVAHATHNTHSLERAGKILFLKNRTLLCERDSLECVSVREQMLGTHEWR